MTGINDFLRQLAKNQPKPPKVDTRRSTIKDHLTFYNGRYKTNRTIGVELEREFTIVDQNKLRGETPENVNARLNLALTKAGLDAVAKRDGSLSNWSTEIVTGADCTRASVRKIVTTIHDVLDKTIGEKGLVRDKSSPRASTHVHVSVLDHTLVNLICLQVFWDLIEDQIVSWAGDDLRSANSYCRKGSDNDSNYFAVATTLQSSSMKRLFFAGMHDKYSALNFATVSQYGTVEFRLWPCWPDADMTASAAEFSHDLVEYVKNTFKNPADVISYFSKLDYDVWNAISPIAMTDNFKRHLEKGRSEVVSERSTKEQVDSAISTSYLTDWDELESRYLVPIDSTVTTASHNRGVVWIQPVVNAAFDDDEF